MASDGTMGQLGDGTSPPALTGYVFADGHCSCEPIREANRASWGLVQTDGQGKQVAWIRGTVPDHLPQTAQAAEFMVGLQSVRHTKQAVVYDDCANVVASFQKDPCSWDPD